MPRESSLAVVVVFVAVVVVVTVERESGVREGEPALLRREAVVFCRLRERPPLPVMAIGGWAPGRTGAGDEMPTREVVEPEPTVAVKLRVLALDEVRLCRTGW